MLLEEDEQEITAHGDLEVRTLRAISGLKIHGQIREFIGYV